MTSEKLKFISSTISKILNYLSKNIIQARIYSIFLSLSILMIAASVSLSIVLVAGEMTLHEFLVIVYKIINFNIMGW